MKKKKNLEKEPEDKILSLEIFSGSKEEFGAQRPVHENFMAFWSDGMVGKMYRETNIYKAFIKKYPKLNRLIMEKMKDVKEEIEEKTTMEVLKPKNKYLYKAYKRMRKLGFSDEELFK